MAKGEKARYWVGILYPENMREDWKDEIDNIVQVPYAYCVHDKDKDKEGNIRKAHVHLILAFPNTTTYNHALNVYKLLDDPNAKGSSINTCEKIIGIRNKYNYLIHDSDACRKQHKHLYDKSERICGNNFDIGSYEQLDVGTKLEIKRELVNLVQEKCILNFFDLTIYVQTNMDMQYQQVFTENQGFFANVVRGFYNKFQMEHNVPQNNPALLFEIAQKERLQNEIAKEKNKK